MKTNTLYGILLALVLSSAASAQVYHTTTQAAASQPGVTGNLVVYTGNYTLGSSSVPAANVVQPSYSGNLTGNLTLTGNSTVTGNLTGNVNAATLGGVLPAGYQPAMQQMILEHAVAGSTDGGSSSTGVNVRVFNVQKVNSISDGIASANLTTGNITLGAGTYYISAYQMVYQGTQNKDIIPILYDATLSANLVVGGTTKDASPACLITTSYLTLAGNTTIQLQAYFELGQANNGMGLRTFNGPLSAQPHKYAEIRIVKQ